MSDDHPIWKQRADETDKAYAAFCVYRDMPAQDRSLKRVPDQIGKSSAYVRWLEEWSRTHDWVERVKAYDQYLDDKIREELEDQRIADRKERVRILRKYRGKILEALERLSPDDASWSEVTHALKTINADLRKELRDEPAEKHEHMGEDGGPIKHSLTWYEGDEED